LKQVVIIGGGAAGMMCGLLAAKGGCGVTIVEKNAKPGRKLYITGKGRCNLTNDCTEEEFLAHVMSNPKFLYSAIYGFSPRETVRFFESMGLPLKTERGRRVFPVSDRSADVIDTLSRNLRRAGAKMMLQTEAEELLTGTEGRVRGVRIRRSGRTEDLAADAVVVATGGLSYPGTGSTGDGFRFADRMGMPVSETSPSLVPIVCAEEYVKEMQGLSLRNVSLHVRSGKKELFAEQGEMMFTHFGITGPLVLSASAVAGHLIGVKPLTAWIDLKPALTEEQLTARFLRMTAEGPNRELKSVLGQLYPGKMQAVMPEVAGVDPERRLRDLTRGEREALVRATLHLPLTFTALRGYNEAVITRGGVDVRRIDAGSMRAKDRDNLYFIGEVLDLDALTGGYNLQIAWSTAAAAARDLTKDTGKEQR